MRAAHGSAAVISRRRYYFARKIKRCYNTFRELIAMIAAYPF